MVHGLTAAALAWVLSGLISDRTPLVNNSIRIDQFTMCLLGSFVGAAVLGGRAVSQRLEFPSELLAGLALGGFAALLSATVFAYLPVPSSSRAFVLFRAVAWAFTGGTTAMALATWIQQRDRRAILQSGLRGLAGGAMAGVIFALPGPAELWQAVAMLVVGAVTGFAVITPLFRRAVAVADLGPRRGPVPGILTLRESILYEGNAVSLGAATLACQGGRIALYPPPAGVVFNGRAVVEATILNSGGTLLVADQRFRIQLIGRPA
jgi:hypothetical protein